MAESIHIHTPSLAGRRTRTLLQLIGLRLITGYTLLIVSFVGLLGADWDIQWHAVIGRDRTFTPPHDMILIALTLNGLLTLTSILIETWWARQNRELAENSTDFLGVLYSSLGSYLIGFGVVCAAIAFPLDTYWHALYGIDVSLWAPFHTMLYVGGFLSVIGIIYILISAAHLAQSQQKTRLMRFGYAGVIVALALLLSRLTTFIIPAFNVSPGGVNLFPLLLCTAVAFVCTLAVRLVPWPGIATLLVLAFLLVYALITLFVPPMMIQLMQAENQVYLPGTESLRLLLVPLLGQSPWLLLTALSIDGYIFLTRQAHWSTTVHNLGVILAASVSTTIVAALMLLALARPSSGGNHSLLPFLLALVIGVAGGLLGGWLGSTISQTIETLRS